MADLAVGPLLLAWKKIPETFPGNFPAFTYLSKKRVAWFKEQSWRACTVASGQKGADGGRVPFFFYLGLYGAGQPLRMPDFGRASGGSGTPAADRAMLEVVLPC